VFSAKGTKIRLPITWLRLAYGTRCGLDEMRSQLISDQNSHSFIVIFLTLAVGKALAGSFLGYRNAETPKGDNAVEQSAISNLPVAPATAAASPGFNTGHVESGGVHYYYEIHGQGEPLLLLHGGLGSIQMFQPLLPLLAAKRKVIAVDLLGHGRTALGERPISTEAIGDDLAVILEALNFGTVDVLGYSFGGQRAFSWRHGIPKKYDAWSLSQRVSRKAASIRK
jgi:hypothetical protein